jgi:tetratricopeptide (TPR) repeat protein
LLHGGARPPEAVARLLDRAAEAYLHFALPHLEPHGSRGELYQETREAWDRFAAAAAAVAELGRMPDPILAASMVEATPPLLERLAALVRGLVLERALFDQAARAILAADLAARLGDRRPYTVVAMPPLDFLRALPRRPHGLMAAFASAQGDHFAAVELARHASWDEPDDLVVRIEILLRDGRPHEAETAIHRLRERAPAHLQLERLESERLVGLARLHHDRHEHDRAVALLERGLEALPRSTALSYHLGLALRLSGRPAAALPRLAAAFGTRPEVLVELGRTRLRQLDVEAARAFFTVAAEDRRTAAAAAIGFAQADRIEGHAARAVATLEALPGVADDVDATLELGAALLDLGKHALALGRLRAAIDLGHRRADVLVLMTRALRLSGALRDARDAVDLAVDEAGAGVGAVVEEGLLAVAQGEEPDVASLLERRARLVWRPQEFFHSSSYRSADAGPSQHFLVQLLGALRRGGIALADGDDRAYNRTLLHLEADLPVRLEPRLEPVGAA